MRSNLLMLHFEDLNFTCNNYKYIFYNMMQIKKLIVAHLFLMLLAGKYNATINALPAYASNAFAFSVMREAICPLKSATAKGRSESNCTSFSFT